MFDLKSLDNNLILNLIRKKAKFKLNPEDFIYDIVCYNITLHNIIIFLKRVQQKAVLRPTRFLDRTHKKN